MPSNKKSLVERQLKNTIKKIIKEILKESLQDEGKTEFVAGLGAYDTSMKLLKAKLLELQKIVNEEAKKFGQPDQDVDINILKYRRDLSNLVDIDRERISESTIKGLINSVSTKPLDEKSIYEKGGWIYQALQMLKGQKESLKKYHKIDDYMNRFNEYKTNLEKLGDDKYKEIIDFKIEDIKDLYDQVISGLTDSLNAVAKIGGDKVRSVKLGPFINENKKLILRKY